MFRPLWIASLLVIAVCGTAGTAHAQQAVNAQWIWFDDGDPATEAPAGKVWFRKEYKADEPSTGAATVACDDEFTLWVNGQLIGKGGGEKAHRFSLSGIVERGTNVFAVEAVNKSGKAGLLVDAEIRGQQGRRIPCDTSAEWKATTAAPQGEGWLKPRFDETAWKAVKVIGAHADSPWKEISFATGELDRFQVAEGFELRKIAGQDLVGSVVAMTWGNRGGLLVAPERGSILTVTDSDGDGVYDKAIEFTNKVRNCQGLCMVFDELYAVGDGPGGTGIFRLPDANHDDLADDVILVATSRGGMGEHGPHDVVFGPDGWLYHNLGNHAEVTNKPEANTPCRNYEEGYLLEPAFEDAGGHAVGKKAPGGTIWRFTPDGKKWWLETVGFRNHYDICFNQRGDLFTFDSDMEWDVNLPFYKPVRVNHCIPGAEFGWRSGAKNWPEWYFDSLPGTVDIGRGSPTGVLFYEHNQFPEKYRGAMLNCDWSMGRIIVAYLKPQGATYTGAWDVLATGNPLNVSDIEVDRDGSVVFCTGGRRTEGGIYRITHIEGAKNAAALKAETIDDVLALPQPQAAWSRELAADARNRLGDEWAQGLAARVKNGTPAQKIRALTLLTQHGPKPAPELLLTATSDVDADVRQFATLLFGDHPTAATAATLTKLLEDTSPVVQRRACEAFVRTGIEPPVAPLLRLLSNGDHWLRFAARLAIERIPPEKILAALPANLDGNVDLQLNWSLAAHHMGADERFVDSAPRDMTRLLKLTKNGSRQRLDLLRLAELWSLRHGAGWRPDASSEGFDRTFGFGPVLVADFRRLAAEPASTKDPVARATLMESAQLLAYLRPAGAVEALSGALATTDDLHLQMHYVLCFRYLDVPWPESVKTQLLAWYESTRDVEGGNSLQGYLRNILTGCLERYSPADRRAFILAWKERPHAARLVVSGSRPAQVQDFDKMVTELLGEIEKEPSGAGQQMVSLMIDLLGRSPSAESQAMLRRLFDDNADRRDLLARALAQHPAAENIPYLLRGVASGDRTTVQLCLEALGKRDHKPAKPDEYRAVILAGLKLGQEGGGRPAVALLKKWVELENKPDDDIAAALAQYQQWFAEKYPDELAPALAKEDTEKTKYTVQQLVEFLERGSAAAAGDVARGRQVFAKANCLKCHRYGNEGEGVGPDLTTLRRRFQKKEILESVLLPSQVISDQYAAVTVETTGGLVHTGMPLPNPGSESLLLLLPDATKLEIPAEKIAERVKARVSVMPEGLFRDLSLEEIADLFAFLETSKNNPEPTSAAASPAAGR